MRFQEGNNSERNARLLSSRELEHWAKGHGTRNTEWTQMISKLLSRSILEMSQHILKSRNFQIESVNMMLWENTNSQSIVNKAVPVKDFQLTLKSLDQSGFTSTIGADQSDTGLQVYRKVNFLQDVCALLVTEDGLVKTHERGWDLLGVGEHENDFRVCNHVSN